MSGVTQADIDAAVDAVSAIVDDGFVVGCCVMSPTDGHEFAAYLSNAFARHRQAAYAAGRDAERAKSAAMLEALRAAESFIRDNETKWGVTINSGEQIRAAIAAGTEGGA